MTTKSDSPAEASVTSPEALLKAAVSGAKATTTTPEPVVTRAGRRIEPLTLSLTVAGLALGTLIGAGSAILAVPRSDGTGVALAEVNAGLEANRLEASRLVIASDRLDKSIAGLREAAEAARSETRIRGAGLTETVGKVETALVAKIAALGERIDQSDKEQAARVAALAGQTEKRLPATAAPATVAKAEPVQTGSIIETKPKSAIVETWAVRDVYDGTAMLEDRHRRLLEVVSGDSIPGIGRVDSIERRAGRWVVVTRQGIVTPQAW